MFEQAKTVPSDPILGLTEAFRTDPHPKKINLGAGVYQDAEGRTPVLACVKEAESRLLAAEKSKNYLPIDGLAEYDARVRELLFGAGHPLTTDGRAVTAQTPGGTGALRVAGDLLRQVRPEAVMWVSQPTWVNHWPLFTAAGMQVKSYRYFDAVSNSLDFPGMMEGLEQVAPGDVVVLHACCHNPSGVDLEADHWPQVAELLARRQAVPLIDSAYQGFGEGLEEDAAGIRLLAERLPEMLICNSFSKILGLYGERVGSLTAVAGTPQAASSVLSQIKASIRTNYSSPPLHGAAIVATVIGDPVLRELWHDELRSMRQRIHRMRHLLTRALDERGIQLSATGNDFIVRQHGMFSFCHLTKEQVLYLRQRHAIYLVESGRMNVAALTETNVDCLADAIAEALQAPVAGA